MTSIAERIKEALKLQEISYAELERKTGISKSTLHRYATGETLKISVSAIQLIAKALDTTPSYLMGFDVPDEKNLGIKETERIVNISELEKMIQKARLDVIALKNHTEKNGQTEITKLLNEIANTLWKCENFEFLLERRKIKE